MMNIQLTSGNIHQLSTNQLKNFFNNKQYREFIQFIILLNKKGENGLIVKKILDSNKEKLNDFVNNEIQKFNSKSADYSLWETPSSDIFNMLRRNFIKRIGSDYNDNDMAKAFLLFTMNYVFVAYTNKKFKKFINVKQRRLFNCKLHRKNACSMH